MSVGGRNPGSKTKRSTAGTEGNVDEQKEDVPPSVSPSDPLVQLLQTLPSMAYLMSASAHDESFQSWDPGYVVAIERAVINGDFVDLYRLLEQQRPLHPRMLPGIAAALRRKTASKGGRKAKLMPSEQRAAAFAVDFKRETQGLTKEEAILDVADRLSTETPLSESVVKRAHSKFGRKGRKGQIGR